MESIGAFEAKTRLSELLERVARGESFEITKHGKPVGRLVPANASLDQTAIAEAVARLRGFAKRTKKMTKADILASRHEGHRI